MDKLSPAVHTGKSILLDREERELVKKGEQVTQQEMWDILEAKRFEGLKKSAINLQGDLIYNKRCPKCTLVPPCKHYKSINQIMNEANRMVGSKPFKNYISPRKLQSLMNTIRDQSW